MSRKLTKKQIEEFKKLLTDQLQQLEKRVGGTVEELGEESEIHPDISDQASQESDLYFDLRVRDREQKLIEKIKKTLKKIEDGTFGICERCGEPIELERLKARPVATLCIDCKNEQEQEEKSRGE